MLILFFNFFLKKNLISWQTTVPCATVAGFCCPLVVTMRPVPKDKLERLVQASCSLMGEQGQPVHIGDPGEWPGSPMTLTAARGLRPEKTGTGFVPELPKLALPQLRSCAGSADALQVPGAALGRTAPVTFRWTRGGGSRWWSVAAELFVLRLELRAALNLGCCSAAYLAGTQLPSKCSRELKPIDPQHLNSRKNL